jgi:hypothetical protein
MLQIFGRLTVVIDHAEVERIDPLEIVGVKHVLRAGSRRVVLPEVGFEQRQYRLEDRQAGRARSLAPCLKSVGKVGIDERKENDSRRVLDLGNHSVELGCGAHQWIDMLDRSDPLILRGSGPRGRD